MKKWQDEVLHSERFKWAEKETGKDHYCRNEMSTSSDKEKLYDDDDISMDIKDDETKFAFLWPYFEFIINVLTSDIAVVAYLGVMIFGILYTLYYVFLNHEMMRLARSKSGYSLVQ